MSDHIYKPGELFVYTNGDRWELGKVKRLREDGKYACWYSTGDTAAVTPPESMHRLTNAYFSPVAHFTLGMLLDHMALMTKILVQGELTEDGETFYEGPAMLCPAELKGRLVLDVMPDTYLDLRYLVIEVQ